MSHELQSMPISQVIANQIEKNILQGEAAAKAENIF